jgi:hypothetical protein
MPTRFRGQVTITQLSGRPGFWDGWTAGKEIGAIAITKCPQPSRIRITKYPHGVSQELLITHTGIMLHCRVTVDGSEQNRESTRVTVEDWVAALAGRLPNAHRLLASPKTPTITKYPRNEHDSVPRDYQIPTGFP